MLVCIVDKQEYKNAILRRKIGQSIEDLKYVCIGSVNKMDDVYKIADALPCLAEVVIDKGTVPLCMILANP